jgi:hypothetical protein
VASEVGPPLAFGDRVRIRTAPETAEAGIDGRLGQIYGHTTPSKGIVTDPVIGEPTSDIAFNVQLDEADVSIWIVPELIELVDHAPGTTIGVGDVSLVRQADGSWERTDR